MQVKCLEWCLRHSRCSVISCNCQDDGDDDGDAHVQRREKRRKKCDKRLLCAIYLISSFDLYELDIFIIPLLYR